MCAYITAIMGLFVVCTDSVSLNWATCTNMNEGLRNILTLGNMRICFFCQELDEKVDFISDQ